MQVDYSLDGCSVQAIKKRIALNPALKEMQLKGYLGHCMNDENQDPLGLCFLEIVGSDINIRHDDEGKAYWTIQDVLNLWA